MIFISVVLVVCAPLALIWSLNTLFTLGIEYTFLTWLAALVALLLVDLRSSKRGS